MIVTTLEGYALKALIFISTKKEKKATITEISKENKISFPYILRICSLLRKGNILMSTKGRKGGYYLARNPKDISLHEIINAVGRKSIEIKCDFGKRTSLKCFQYECLSLPAWQYILDETNNLFNKITLDVLIERSKKYEHSANTDN